MCQKEKYTGNKQAVFSQRKATINEFYSNKHRPGDRWNCKCTLEATDDPITDIPGETNKERPQPRLKENPAKTKQIFDNSHPYFPKSCKGCKFNKGWFTNFFNISQGNNCFSCQSVQKLFLSNNSIDEIRKYIRDNNLSYSNTNLSKHKNIITQYILQSKKVASRLVVHIRSYNEYEAADYIGNNINKFKYYKISPLGVNKNKSLQSDLDNIEKKKKRGIIAYHIYTFEYQNETWILKTEEHKKGFEQPYAIYKKKSRGGHLTDPHCIIATTLGFVAKLHP